MSTLVCATFPSGLVILEALSLKPIETAESPIVSCTYGV